MKINFNQYIKESVDESFDKQAWERMRYVRQILMTNYGFFADLVTRLNVRQIPKKLEKKIPTAATDGRSLYYNPEYVNSFKNSAELLFVYCHELMHNSLLHFDRMGTRNPKMWNYATDYAINYIIRDIGKMPTNILYDEKYAEMTAEQIYDILSKDKEARKKAESGKSAGDVVPGNSLDGGIGEGGEMDDNEPFDGNCPNCGHDLNDDGDEGNEGGDKNGGGQGGGDENGDGGEGGEETGDGQGDGQGDGNKKGKHWSDKVKDGKITCPRCGAETNIKGKPMPGDNGEFGNKGLVDKWNDANVAAAANAGLYGNLPGSMTRYINSFKKAKVNWKAALKKILQDFISKYAYKLPNRRNVYKNEYIYGIKRDAGGFKTGVIMVDTSGSITQEMLDEFAGEIRGVCKSYDVKDLYVLYCDTQVYEPVDAFIRGKKFNIQKLKPRGGGGTSFKPPFEWVYKNMIRKGNIPSFIIYFTDAAGDFPKRSYQSTENGRISLASIENVTLWVIVDNTDFKLSQLPFGKIIHVKSGPGK